MVVTHKKSVGLLIGISALLASSIIGAAVIAYLRLTRYTEYEANTMATLDETNRLVFEELPILAGADLLSTETGGNTWTTTGPREGSTIWYGRYLNAEYEVQIGDEAGPILDKLRAQLIEDGWRLLVSNNHAGGFLVTTGTACISTYTVSVAPTLSGTMVDEAVPKTGGIADTSATRIVLKIYADYLVQDPHPPFPEPLKYYGLPYMVDTYVVLTCSDGSDAPLHTFATDP